MHFYLGAELVNEDAAGGVPKQSSHGGAHPAKALHVRRQLRALDTVPGHARIDHHLGNGRPRRHSDQANVGEHHRHLPVHRNRQCRRRPQHTYIPPPPQKKNDQDSTFFESEKKTTTT